MDAIMLPEVKLKRPSQQDHVCDAEMRLSGNPDNDYEY